MDFDTSLYFVTDGSTDSRSTRRAPRRQSLFADVVERAVQLEELADDIAVRDLVPTR